MIRTIMSDLSDATQPLGGSSPAAECRLVVSTTNRWRFTSERAAVRPRQFTESGASGGKHRPTRGSRRFEIGLVSLGHRGAPAGVAVRFQLGVPSTAALS
jgi:hypothetical protein